MNFRRQSRREFIKTAATSAALLSPTLGLAGTVKSLPTVLRVLSQNNQIPQWVANLAPWQWYQIPNTKLSSVDPAIRSLGFTGPSAKIDAWCGATLKRKGSIYMLGAAGGHKDYGGNEVNMLQLNVETPKWIQARAPSLNSDIIGPADNDSAQFYLDLRPSSTHTYYATQFWEAGNRMFVMPSPGFNLGGPIPAGWPYRNTTSYIYSYNLNKNDWDAPTAWSQYPGGGDFTACLCVKHPITEDIYYSRNSSDGWYRFRPTDNSWTKLSNVSRGSWYCGSAIDPIRNRILVYGSYNGDGPEVYDLNGTKQNVSFGGLGASALAMGGYPGAIYDEVNNKFLCLFNSNGSISVRRVDPLTWVIDAPSMSGTPPTSRLTGIQNSVQYVPELKGFVIANKHDGNVYFVRTAI